MNPESYCCHNCSNKYDLAYFIPHILPSCYHNICSDCIYKGLDKNQGYIICGKCGTPNSGTKITDFPKSHEIIRELENSSTISNEGTEDQMEREMSTPTFDTSKDRVILNEFVSPSTRDMTAKEKKTGDNKVEPIDRLLEY